MISSSEVEKKAVKGDIAATARAMNGMHEKNGMDEAVGSAGLPWCGGFVKKMFEVSGYGDALKGIGNPLYVPSYIYKNGESGPMHDFVETIGKNPPSVGSIITFKGMNHIGVVSKVNTDDGSFEITQGNTTDMVQTLKYTMKDFEGHLDKKYLSAEKLNAHNKEQNPTAPTLGNNKLFTETPSLEQAQESVKKNGAVGSYNMFSSLFGIDKDKPKETEKDPMKNMFAQMLTALLILASGQEIKIEPSATEQQRRDAMGQVDKQMGREAQVQPKPTPISMQSVTTHSSPPATPSPSAKAGKEMDVSNWR